MDGKWLWSGRRGDGQDYQLQGEGRGHRVMRALLSRARPRDMDWPEERAWCTKGAATEVLGGVRLWADNLVGLWQGRYLHSEHTRKRTMGGFIAWLEQVSLWAEARRDGGRVVPIG